MIDSTEQLTGQLWFDSFLDLTQGLEDQYSDSEIKALYPGAWLLLSMRKSQESPLSYSGERLAVGDYIPVECIYMSPLSSYSAYDLSQDFRYTVTGDAFVTEYRKNGSTGQIQVDWHWQTMEEARDDLAFLQDTFFYDLILDEQCLYQRLSNRYHLVQVASTLYLIQGGNGRNQFERLWSIYILIPA